MLKFHFLFLKVTFNSQVILTTYYVYLLDHMLCFENVTLNAEQYDRCVKVAVFVNGGYLEKLLI